MGKAARAKRERREARLAAPPATTRAAPTRLIAFGAVLVLAAVAAVVALVVVRSGGSAPAAESTASASAASERSVRGGAALAGLQTGPAPWLPEQEQLPARLDAIGVPFSNMEGTAVHIHPVLSVFANGRTVEVPKDIGISYAEQAMAALHTHDTVGTIHVESPEVRDYTLGQFFDVWGVRLTRTCLGGYCADGRKQLRAFVDGDPVRNPRRVTLTDGARIVIAYGTPAQIKSATS